MSCQYSVGLKHMNWQKKVSKFAVLSTIWCLSGGGKNKVFTQTIPGGCYFSNNLSSSLQEQVNSSFAISKIIVIWEWLSLLQLQDEIKEYFYITYIQLSNHTKKIKKTHRQLNFISL